MKAGKPSVITRLEMHPALAEGFDGMAIGDKIIVITWFHQAQHYILKLHPRDDKTIPGVNADVSKHQNAF